MKTKILLIIMLLTALCSISATAKTAPIITASILRYDPTPAEPGSTFDVWIQLSNAGTTANNVAIKFIPEYPFSIPGEETGYVEVGKLSSTEEYVTKFTIYADINAPTGDRTIKFWYKYDSANWIQFEGIITLQTTSTALIIRDYKVSPEQAIPGQQADVTLALENIGALGIKNIDVKLDLSEVPQFSTIGTGTVQRIQNIGPGKEAQIKFTLASDTSTEVKLYSIPVTITYQDTTNKNYETTGKISLVMNAEPEIYVIVDETDFQAQKKPGTVTLQVINKGIVNIKYTTMKIIGTPDYEVLSPSNIAYVGNLDNDDFETVEFMIKPKIKDPTVHVELDFKDPYNVNFKQQYTLPLRIYSAKELGKAKSPIGTIIFVLIIAAIGFYFWRRHRRKKKGKK